MKPVSSNVSFSHLEHQTLKYWEEHNVFEQQNAQRQQAPIFSFYDGPPFANGLPHYGHLLANTVKDVVPRYWIMRGYQVNRRFGWDCHGLPVEFEVEKNHNLKGKADVVKWGIERFNQACSDSVMHYTDQWRKTITRLGRWVDWNQQYRTMDRDFMESVWWVFKTLYKGNLVYKDFKVVPYSPRTASVVSNFEANQNYQNVQSPSVVVKLKAVDSECWFLVWTTTPWTLPANLAVAIDEDIEYVTIKDHKTQQLWVVAEKRLQWLYQDKHNIGSYTVLKKNKGTVFINCKYKPLFSFYEDTPNAFRLLAASYVTTSDGTGLVHQAPAYGENDFFTCQQYSIGLVDPLDENGVFNNEISQLQGLYFKDANKVILRLLKEQDSIVLHSTIEHSYPHDERTNTPLIYKAVPSWYIAVEKIAQRLVDHNSTINWVPSHLKEGRMGTWLKNARDWAVSRNRFWGTPIPAWECSQNPQHVHIIGSVQELESLVNKKLPDIHAHHVMSLTWQCSQCCGKMQNTKSVFDCWFESGSMPYAQLHYPFANKDTFEQIFPADFIAEGLDQTRGWFYTLNILACALFDKPAFKNVVVNGVILDKTGKKMSKRHKNYTPPDNLIEEYGADSVRLYMLNSNLLRGEDMIFSDEGVKDITRSVLLPIWNTYSFLATYAYADSWQPNKKLLQDPVTSDNQFDRWIISRLHTLIQYVHTHMDAYELYRVVPHLLSFTTELTNWYVRLNRKRFWGTTKSSLDQEAAYSTLFYVLTHYVRLLAPFAPFISESLYRELTANLSGAKISVHLEQMPLAHPKLIDSDLEQLMTLTQTIINQGRHLRQKNKLKIRQPLAQLTIVTNNPAYNKALSATEQVIKEELNVKKVTYSTNESQYVTITLAPNLKRLGPRLGAKVKLIKQELTTIGQNPQLLADTIDKITNGLDVTIAEQQLTSEDFLITRTPKDKGDLVACENEITVVLNTELSVDLINEGLAREVVNRIQNHRKDSRLNVSDRITIEIIASQQLITAIETNRAYILGETLGKDIALITKEGSATLKFVDNFMINDMPCVIAIEKVS